MTPEQLDRVEDAAARAADHIDPAADHHLRRIHPTLPEPVGIELLSPGAVLETEGIRPAEAVPIGHVKAEREDVVATSKLPQQPVGGRARVAALRGDQLDHDRRRRRRRAVDRPKKTAARTAAAATSGVTGCFMAHNCRASAATPSITKLRARSLSLKQGTGKSTVFGLLVDHAEVSACLKFFCQPTDEASGAPVACRLPAGRQTLASAKPGRHGPDHPIGAGRIGRNADRAPGRGP